MQLRVIGFLFAVLSAPLFADVDSGEWSLAILPDTQYYSESYPDTFADQTTWIRDNRATENILYTLHLGDITDNNNTAQWIVAQESLNILDSPYAFVWGNHDCGTLGAGSSRSTNGEAYLPAGNYSSWPTFGGTKDSNIMANSYHLFEAWGHQWIIICLEWAPSDEAVTWADTVMQAHPEHYGILICHTYMYHDDTRYDQALGTQSWGPWSYGVTGSVNDGQELWDKLVKNNRFVMTLNGHVLGDGTGYLNSKNNAQESVHQMLINYQMRPSGGQGYLRMLTFGADGRTVTARSYSPTLDSELTASDHAFSFTLDLGVDDLDLDGVPDYYDPDFDWDLDGLNNQVEHDIHRTSTLRPDTDGDGISDFEEVRTATNPLQPQ